jgi:hypothetical protein
MQIISIVANLACNLTMLMIHTPISIYTIVSYYEVLRKPARQHLNLTMTVATREQFKPLMQAVMVQRHNKRNNNANRN